MERNLHYLQNQLGLYLKGNLHLKPIQLAHSWNEIYVSNFHKVSTETRCGPMLKDETVHYIPAKITGEKRRAPEGVWVQGGQIELPILASTLSTDQRNPNQE